MIYRPASVTRTWVVYNHTYGGQVFYIGCCKLSDLYTPPDALSNSEWRIFVTSSMLISVDVVEMFDNVEMAKITHFNMVTQQKPYCNLKGKTYNRRTSVRHIDTGEIFDNASIAAETFGISRQAMSKHLNHRPGYNTVNKQRFERI